MAKHQQQRDADHDPTDPGHGQVTRPTTIDNHQHDRGRVVHQGPEDVADHHDLDGQADPLHERGVGANHPGRSHDHVIQREVGNKPGDQEYSESHGQPPSKIGTSELDLEPEDHRKHHRIEKKLDRRTERRPQPTEERARMTGRKRPPRQLGEEEAVGHQGPDQPDWGEEVAGH